jgi:ribosomal protein S18 acetylase RimI-like enzyme
LRYCVARDESEIVGAVGCSVDDAHQTAWLLGPHLADTGGGDDEPAVVDQLWAKLLQRIPHSIKKLTAYVEQSNDFAKGFWQRRGLIPKEHSVVFEWRQPLGDAPPAAALRLHFLGEDQEREFRSLYSSLFPYSWPNADEVIAGANDLGSLVSLGTNKQLTGFVVFGTEAGQGRIYTLGVAPTERRQGIGRQLLLGGLAQLVERRVSRVTLTATAANLNARALYESVGFVQAYVGVALEGTVAAAKRALDPR